MVVETAQAAAEAAPAFGQAGLGVAEIGLLFAVFSAAIAAGQFASEWLRWISGFGAKRQDDLKADHNSLEVTLKADLAAMGSKLDTTVGELHRRINDLRNEHHKSELHMAESYATKTDLKEMETRIIEHIDRALPRRPVRR